jgi:hypothetical protein
VGLGKRRRMMFGHGGYFLHCHGCGGLWWRLLNEAEAQGRNELTSAAKPASARDAPQPACSRHGGYGKVQQHLRGPSVWSGQHPPAGPMHSRLSAHSYETCRAGAKVRKMFLLLNKQRARALTAELPANSMTCMLLAMEACRSDLLTLHEISTDPRDSSDCVL